MKYCIHISTTSTKLLHMCHYIDRIIEDTPLDRVFLYVEDSLALADEARAQFKHISPSLVEIIHAPKSDDLANFNRTLSNYSVTDNIWIVSIKDTITNSDALLETYCAIIDDATTPYAYGFYGYVMDACPLGDVRGLVHVIDQTFSTCYHRSYFHDKWTKYTDTLRPLLDVTKDSNLIFSNWFAVNSIERFTIDVPWCNIDLLKKSNPHYTSTSDLNLSKGIRILQQNNLWYMKQSNQIVVNHIPLQYYHLNRPVVRYENVALLLESRFDVSYELVLQQIIRFLPANFRIILMVTPAVLDPWKQLVQKITKRVSHPGILIAPLTRPLTNIQDYNAIMLDTKFWKQFTMFKKVLLFQTDTMMFKYGLESYMDYDYIGSPWPSDYGLAKGVGNGGFSLRTIQAMITCLEKKDTIIIPSYKNSEENLKTFNGIHPEDVFYSFAMPQCGFTIATPSIACYFANESVQFNKDTLGSHQLYKFNKDLYDICLSTSIVPYKHVLRTDIGTHRYGWVHVKKALDILFNNPNGIELRSYGDLDIEYSRSEWVGIFHLTPLSTKKYFSFCNINKFKNNPIFHYNLQFCRGVFTLSKYLAKIWRDIFAELKLDIPVDTVYHPVGFDGEFDPAIIDTIKTVVMVGSQLRRPSTLFQLDLPGYQKVWLSGREKPYAMGLLDEECVEFGVTLTEEQKASVELLLLNNHDYDTLINNSFLIVHQVNASANNAIIEAISRNIPIFCNRLEAAEEYLGKNYPLYFDDVADLGSLLQNKTRIHEAHEYLKSNQDLKKQVTMDSFLSGILNSQITKRILTQTLPPFLQSYSELKM
jgi:hypothetical protein